MKRSISLRTQLFGLMALLVLIQSLALVFALTISRVFLMLDAEAFRLFENATFARAQSYNTSVGQLVGSMAAQTKELGEGLRAIAAREDIQEDALYLSDEAYVEAASTGTAALISLLRGNTVSGAFLVLNGSNAQKDTPGAHSCVYLRNAAIGSTLEDTSNYLLEIGPISVTQGRKIPTSINWRLDLPQLGKTDADARFYTAPVAVVAEQPRAEMERYGYWSTPVDIIGDGQRVVTYTMPLIARDGTAYGVLGVEISLSLFTQHYLPSVELPYQNSFFSIACVEEESIHLDWFIPGGPIAQVYLPQGDSLPLKAVPTTILRETHVEGLGAMYCSIEPITMYSRNSPFYGESWSLIGFVPKDILHETSSGVRATLVTSIVLTTVGAFVAIFVLLYITTRRISGLSEYVRTLTPYADIRFSRTGILEIDELTSAVEKLNQSVMNASKTTSKILELTLMPIGGYEVSSEVGYVILTEYIYRLLDIPVGTEVSKDAWAQLHERLISMPAKGYEDIYRFTDAQGVDKWLRILEAPSDTGRVGIILDVTKDIEEHRRLAHELDYDALTHLYNRDAFKREVFRLIGDAPDKVGGMLFIDLDNLKYTNDTYGHDMGDRLIIRAGEIFRQFTTYGGIVSRISGDEFAVYLHGYDTQADVRKVVHNLFSQNADFTLRTPDGQQQRVRFSAGIAYYPADSENVIDLLKLSDYAMYEAKHNQKGSIFEFDKDSYKENAYLLENRESINLLLDEKLIRFAFQPIVDIRTGEIFGYEALMRPLLDNFKSPLEILSVAASQSKLGQLEQMVMTMAFQVILDHRDVLGEKKMFVNSIPSQTLTPEGHLALKRNFGEIFDRVVIEITEAENDAPEQLAHKLAYLRENGISVAIDDYGSGYSNEMRILSIMPEIVKVDIAMISYVDQDKDKQQLLSNLLSFCKPRGIRIVAEGVERREELAELIRLGVDFVQGYYTGRGGFELEPLSDKVVKEIRYLQRLREEEAYE